MGQLLFTGIVPPERVPVLADKLMGGDFFTGFGIRTIAKGEARYNPLSYHNGSVWPHDVGMILRGFGRCGLQAQARRLVEGLLKVAEARGWRLPELFSGHAAVPGFGPTDYPKACSPQAWAAAAAFQSMEALLGLEIDAAKGQVRLNPAALPPEWGPVKIENLAFNGGRIDFVLNPLPGGRWDAKVTRRQGTPIHIVNDCAPDSSRLGRAVRSLLGLQPR
jgi:glycogen debranching enzyme